MRPERPDRKKEPSPRTGIDWSGAYYPLAFLYLLTLLVILRGEHCWGFPEPSVPEGELGLAVLAYLGIPSNAPPAG